MKSWGSVVEIETRRRILLSVYAAAYEIHNDSLISDEKFDKMSLEVDLTIKTKNKKMDKWFKENFDSSTGMWVRKHPEIKKLEIIYNSLKY